MKRILFTALISLGVFFVIFDVRGFREPGSFIPTLKNWLRTKFSSVETLYDESRESVVDRIKGIKKVGQKEKALDLTSRVREYFESPKSLALIDHPPRVYGTKWYFLEPRFVASNLFQVAYEDGHMRGELIVLVEEEKGGELKFKTLWDSLKATH